MNKPFSLAIVLAACALLATPAAAQKVNIDYAHDHDFSTVKTFQYVDTADTNTKDALMAERIVSKIKAELTEGGLTEVDSDPDIFVTYHVASQQNQVFNTTGYAAGGWGRGWGGWGGGMTTATTTVSTYTEGTLVIDAYEAPGKKMIWRGTGTVTLKNKPEKRVQQIDNILRKLGSKWDKILANQGK